MAEGEGEAAAEEEEGQEEAQEQEALEPYEEEEAEAEAEAEEEDEDAQPLASAIAVVGESRRVRGDARHINSSSRLLKMAGVLGGGDDDETGERRSRPRHKLTLAKDRRGGGENKRKNNRGARGAGEQERQAPAARDRRGGASDADLRERLKKKRQRRDSEARGADSEIGVDGVYVRPALSRAPPSLRVDSPRAPPRLLILGMALIFRLPCCARTSGTAPRTAVCNRV